VVAASLLAALAATSCEPGVATQVMVNIDVQPGIQVLATAVEIRVFDGEGAERGRQRLELTAPRGTPLRLPLVPEGGDASRTWLVEVAVRGERDAIIALARARGGYEAGVLRSALLCVYDGCEATACGLVEDTCLAGGSCQTCVEGSCRAVPMRAELEPGDVVLRCPGRTSTADASVGP